MATDTSIVLIEDKSTLQIKFFDTNYQISPELPDVFCKQPRNIWSLLPRITVSTCRCKWDALITSDISARRTLEGLAAVRRGDGRQPGGTRPLFSRCVPPCFCSLIDTWRAPLPVHEISGRRVATRGWVKMASAVLTCRSLSADATLAAGVPH